MSFVLKLQTNVEHVKLTADRIHQTIIGLFGNIESNLRMLAENTTTHLCSMNITEKLQRGIENVTTETHNKSQSYIIDDIDLIGVSFLVRSYQTTNVKLLIADLTLALAMDLTFNYFQITYRKTNDFVLQNEPIFDYQYEPCESTITLEPAPFSAKFKVSRTMIETRTEHGVTVGIGNSSFFFQNFVESDREDCIYLCWDEYVDNIDLKEEAKQSSLMHASNSNDDGELSVLTIVCIAFSIASLVLTLCVYSILTKLRSVPGLNNMALCVSLIISQALTLLNSATTISTPEICVAIGILLHFSLLSGFFWMFICTYHMAKTFVNLKVKSTSETNTKSIFIWYTVFVEGISLAVIACVFVYGILVEHTPMVYGGTPCYVQGKTSILYFVAIPVGAVIKTNLTMFMLVIVKISSLPDMAESSTRERKNLVIFAKLSTVTGLTWIFGFLYQFSAVQLFAYLFILFNAGQGVFIMLAFVTNGRVYTMMKNREWSQKQGKYSSSQTRTGAQSNHSGTRDTHNTNVSSNNAE